jgi:hypothetical protein
LRSGPRAFAFLLACGLAAGSVADAAAQDRCFIGSVDDDRGCTFDAPRWVGEFATLSANAVIGGLTAGFVQEFRGGSFRDGFMHGIVGGAIVYAGKRVAAESFTGAGAIGRTVAASGASAVRNAGAGEPLFDRLTLPAGPLWFDVSTRTKRVRARVDAATLAWLLYGIAEPELAFDAGESLSSLMPVFHTDGKLLQFGSDSVHAAGVTNAGVYFVADVPAYGPNVARRNAAHERIHVLQTDQFAIQWTDPAAQWLAGRLPALRPALRFVAINLSTELMRIGSGLIAEHGDRPWELESIFFAR